MQILLCAATELEISPTIQYLVQNGKRKSFSCYSVNQSEIYPFVSGVGMTAMAFALARCKNIKHIDLLVHAGLSGAFDPSLALGSIVEVTDERFGDLGAEESDGSLTNLFDLGLLEANQFPFKEGRIHKVKSVVESGLPQVSGITVNSCSGCSQTIRRRLIEFGADVESMEGAAVFYAARMMDVPFISIRGISNRVEPRNKKSWAIEQAVDRLNEFIISYLKKLST